jgi:hypothetical protein
MDAERLITAAGLPTLAYWGYFVLRVLTELRQPQASEQTTVPSTSWAILYYPYATCYGTYAKTTDSADLGHGV